MGMFSHLAHLRSPEIPPFAELPQTREGLWEFMQKLYSSDKAIRPIAHKIWEDGGCKNGDELACEHGYRWPPPVLLKEAHWIDAKWQLDIVCETDFSTVWYALTDWQATRALESVAK